MLTAQQTATYHFIRQYMQERDMAPTGSEIAAAIGISSRGVVHRYLQALEREGLITLSPHRRRNILLVSTEEEFDDSEGGSTTGVALPILGKIAAGSPIEAIEDSRVLDFATLVGPNRYMLEVNGDSMVGDNIFDGDYILCEEAQQAKQGAIVIALIDNQEVTLKRFQHEGDEHVRLLASNPRMSPMVYVADRVSIQAIYLGLLRLEH